MKRLQSAKSISRTCLVGAAFASLLSACFGHPYTSVYLVNHDETAYCVTFVDTQSGGSTDYPVGARAAGGLFSFPGETAGTILLRRIDEPVIAQVGITAGRPNLVEIESGALTVDDKADLSNKPGGSFEERSGCAVVSGSPSLANPSQSGG